MESPFFPKDLCFPTDGALCGVWTGWGMELFSFIFWLLRFRARYLVNHILARKKGSLRNEVISLEESLDL